MAGGNLHPLANETPERMLSVECDVADDAAVEFAFDDVLARWDRIDVIINNAVVLAVGPNEERSVVSLCRKVEINYLGFVRTLRAVLP